MLYLFIALAVIVVIGIIWKTTAGRKIGTAGAAQINKIGDAALDKDPLAVMNYENDMDAAAIMRTEPQMNIINGNMTGAARRVQEEDNELKQMQGRVDQALRLEAEFRAKGDPVQADQFATAAAAKDTEMQAKQAAHDVTVKGYGLLKQQYDTAVTQIRDARKRIAERQKKAVELKQQLNLSEAVKTAVTVANGVNTADFNRMGQSSRAEDKLKQMIDANMATGKTHEDIFAADVDPNAAANAALDRAMETKTAQDRMAARRAALGISTPSPHSPDAQKPSTPVAAG